MTWLTTLQNEWLDHWLNFWIICVATPLILCIVHIFYNVLGRDKKRGIWKT